MSWAFTLHDHGWRTWFSSFMANRCIPNCSTSWLIAACAATTGVNVRITRTGHVLHWHNRDVCLTEVAAAAEQELPQGRRLLNYRLRGEHGGHLACRHGIHYQTTFQVETLPPDIFLHVHEEILADGGKRGLLHNFQPHHRLALAPLGMIAVEARAGCLFLSAFHTFPEEYTIVKSQSLIEKKS